MSDTRFVINDTLNESQKVLYTGGLPSNNQTVLLSDSIENYNAILVRIRGDLYGMGTLYIPKILIEYDTTTNDYNLWEVPAFQGGAYGWVSMKFHDETHVLIHNRGFSGWESPTLFTVIGIK